MRLSGVFTRLQDQSPDILARLARRPGLLWLYWLWFASVVPLPELAYWTYAKEITGYRIVGFEYMWRVPLGYALILGALALILVVVGRLRGKAVSVGAVVFIGAFLGICGALKVGAKGLHLHHWATALLAAGAAAQIARLAVRYASLWHLVVSRTVAVTVLLVVGLSSVFAFRYFSREHNALARLPPVSKPAPNVLLIVLDTVRAKSLSLYGYTRPTSPNLDRFAAGGTVFERALSTAPWTLPSHSSLFTGRLPHELGASFSSPLDGTYPTLAEVLSRQGYLTAGFSANIAYVSKAHGLGRGFARFEDEMTTAYTSFSATAVGSMIIDAADLKSRFGTHENFGRKSAEMINANFLQWLSGRDASRPFFAFLNFYDAHVPYLPPGEFATDFSVKVGKKFHGEQGLGSFAPGDLQDFQNAYDGAVAYLDDQVGRLIAALRQRGVLDNTVVVITADHGEQFGEHNLLDHTASLYMPLLHVPLVIVYPASIPARRVATPVSLRDVAATILDLAGFAGSSTLAGSSLRPRMMGGAETDDDVRLFAEVDRVNEGYPAWYPARRGRMATIVSRDAQYIFNYGTKQEELFRLDPNMDELKDVAATDTALLAAYRKELEKVRPSNGGERR